MLTLLFVSFLLYVKVASFNLTFDMHLLNLIFLMPFRSRFHVFVEGSSNFERAGLKFPDLRGVKVFLFYSLIHSLFQLFYFYL